MTPGITQADRYMKMLESLIHPIEQRCGNAGLTAQPDHEYWGLVYGWYPLHLKDAEHFQH